MPWLDIIPTLSFSSFSLSLLSFISCFSQPQIPASLYQNILIKLKKLSLLSQAIVALVYLVSLLVSDPSHFVSAPLLFKVYSCWTSTFEIWASYQFVPSGEPLQGRFWCSVSLMSISSIEVEGLYKCYIECECVFLPLHKCFFPLSIHSLNTFLDTMNTYISPILYNLKFIWDFTDCWSYDISIFFWEQWTVNSSTANLFIEIV